MPASEARQGTLVFQSYKPGPRPGWIDVCMGGVRGWAEKNGYAYREIGDELFDNVPQWYMDKCRNSRLPATDLGRVMWAQRFLQEGWSRAVWVDADLLIFAPESFSIEAFDQFAFCREVVVYRSDGQIVGERRVNNSISVYGRGNTFLPYYGEACLRRATAVDDQLHSCEVGTILLTGLNRLSPLPLLEDVGCFDARIQHAIDDGHETWLRFYADALRRPVHAANLCHSFSLLEEQADRHVPAERADRVVEMLLKTRGDVVNRFLGPAAQAERPERLGV